MDINGLIYFGQTVTDPYILSTRQFIHLKIIARNYEQVKSEFSMLTVDGLLYSES